MKKTILLLAVVLGSLSLITSCSDDDVYSPTPPEINVPNNGTPTEVPIEGTVDFNFVVEAAKGYDSHILTWSAGMVIQTPVEIAQGETTFTVSGKYTAGHVVGPGGISLAVTDQEGNSSYATYAVVVIGIE